jgi:DNA-binding response OmpR family regulator
MNILIAEDDPLTLDALLDQHIFLLRKKIERNPAQPELIRSVRSVRSVGYRLGSADGTG